MVSKTVRWAVPFVAALAIAVGISQAGQAKVDVTGTWNFDVQTSAGNGAPTMTFKQAGEKLTGHYTGTFGEADLEGTVKGNQIAFSFSADLQGTSLTSEYKGTVESATSMKGTLEISGLGSGTFTAKKK
jgi:hypothetical protein